MAVWLKRLAIGVAALVVLLVALVFGALLLVDTEALKRVVSAQVEEHTGRELTIEGDLGLSVFPWIGFELGRARLANAAGFGERPFLALERVELRVRLLPLFRRAVAVDRVVLHGLEVNLARDGAGRGNWEDLVAGGEGPSREAGGKPDTGTGDAVNEPAAAPDMDLRVEGVEVRGANLHWRDAAAGQSVSVRDLDLTTGPLEFGAATPVRLRFSLEPSGAPSLAVELRTDATFDPEGPRVRLQGLALDLDARGEALPGGELAARVGGDIDADLAQGRVLVEPLTLGLADIVSARGRLVADTAGETPAVNGDLEIAEFSPRKLARALDVALPDDLDRRALQRASAAFSFSAAGESVRIDDLVIAFDDTRVIGSARAAGGDIPEAGLALEVDAVDLDRYLPAAPEQEEGGDTAATGDGSGSAAGGGGEDPVAALPLESLRGVRAEAAIDVGRLAARGLEATDVALRARLDDGLLTLRRLSANAADGSLRLGARLDARGDTPAVSTQIQLGGIQAAPLLRALTGDTPVHGRLDADIALDTAGGTLEAWIGALGGELATTFSDGAAEGINIAQRIRVARAKLRGEQVDEAAEQRRTDFSRLHFAATVRDGVVRSDTLDLRAPLLRVGGSGMVDLPRRKLDYVARVRVTGTLRGQGGEELDEVEGLEIPLRIHGPLAAPEIELAFEEALEARLKEKRKALEREAKEAVEKTKQEAGEAADKEKERLREKRKEKERELEEKLEKEKKKKEREAEEKLEKELEGLFD